VGGQIFERSLFEQYNAKAYQFTDASKRYFLALAHSKEMVCGTRADLWVEEGFM
jgi:hypothetical protein